MRRLRRAAVAGISHTGNPVFQKSSTDSVFSLKNCALSRLMGVLILELAEIFVFQMTKEGTRKLQLIAQSTNYLEKGWTRTWPLKFSSSEFSKLRWI